METDQLVSFTALIITYCFSNSHINTLKYWFQVFMFKKKRKEEMLNYLLHLLHSGSHISSTHVIKIFPLHHTLKITKCIFIIFFTLLLLNWYLVNNSRYFKSMIICIKKDSYISCKNYNDKVLKHIIEIIIILKKFKSIVLNIFII